MISSVCGRVATVGPDGVVIEVGGVGLFLSCTPAVVAGLRAGETARLSTALVVREDALTLYGFADDDERLVFELLQTATGVGPRLAQAVLAVHRPDAIRRAVATEDLAALTLVPGIGRKGAQRIVLDLRDRLGPETGPRSGAAGTTAAESGWREQVRSGLIGLGWSAREADEALVEVAAEAADQLDPSDGAPPDVAVLLRSALRRLSSR